jgi:hypothetical protein
MQLNLNYFCKNISINENSLLFACNRDLIKKNIKNTSINPKAKQANDAMPAFYVINAEGIST